MNDAGPGFSSLKVIFLQRIPTDGPDRRQGPKPSEIFTLHIDFSLETRCGTNIAGQLLHEILRPSAGPEKFSPLIP
ncbi:MAG: hypothetical protein HHJ19_09370 [Polaromonas sp.]|nr:hypothetical protein [Polaromonas sp.]